MLVNGQYQPTGSVVQGQLKLALELPFSWAQAIAQMW